MKNSKLYVYPSGLFLEDNDNPRSWVTPCGLEADIEFMSDPQIAQHILLCNQYGFYPQVIIMCGKEKGGNEIKIAP
jgi:hypothetical protein